MFVRNCLTAGDFVTLVPIGLPLSLQYNESGTLESATIEYLDPPILRESEDLQPHEVVTLSQDFVSQLISSDTVPAHIPIQGGTTWVKGVLYTSKLYTQGAEDIYCMSDFWITEYMKSPETFNFFAGNVDSLAAAFSGATSIRQWLVAASFNLLPGFLVSSGVTREKFLKQIASSDYKFIYPLVSSYMIYRRSAMIWTSTGLKFLKVDTKSVYADSNGYIKSTLSDSQTEISITVDYSDIVTFNIHKGDTLVLDCYHRIIYNDVHNDTPISTTVPCKCGKIIHVPESGVVQCEDSHCVSRMYPAIVHLLSTLGLPVISYDRYQDLVWGGSWISMSDIFAIDEYKEVNIDVTLSRLLQSIIPVQILSDTSVISAFTNRCNNNVNSILYYMHHPDKISIDLSMDRTQVQPLCSWMSDPCNISDFESLLSLDQIHIIDTDKKFEGAPIFRSKNIMLTGAFQHGSIDDVASILRSYSATVVTQFSENINCIIIGDLLEDVNGVAVRKAKQLHIPIFQESEFFAEYEIDKDLAENL